MRYLAIFMAFSFSDFIQQNVRQGWRSTISRVNSFTIVDTKGEQYIAELTGAYSIVMIMGTPGMPTTE